jgi:hypothetical protein
VLISQWHFEDAKAIGGRTKSLPLEIHRRAFRTTVIGTSLFSPVASRSSGQALPALCKHSATRVANAHAEVSCQRPILAWGCVAMLLTVIGQDRDEVAFGRSGPTWGRFGGGCMGLLTTCRRNGPPAVIRPLGLGDAFDSDLRLTALQLQRSKWQQNRKRICKVWVKPRIGGGC